MPKLWSETIASHRREVHDAIIDATVQEVAHHGLLNVNMSQIAHASGIGRATLYKYFRDVESILRAWHEREISNHIGRLQEVSESAGTPREKIAAVLLEFALITHQARGHADSELATLLHRDRSVVHAEHDVRRLLTRLLREAAANKEIRDDVDPRELAAYCLHAVSASTTLSSKAAVRRLVDVILSGLQRRN